MKIGRLIAAILISGLALGCDGGGGGDSSQVVQQKVTAEGGVVKADNGATITIPAGALDKPTTIEISTVSADSLSASAPVGLLASGTAVVCQPHGLTFQKPVAIDMPVPADATAILRLDDESDTTWATVPDATLDSGRAAIQTDHFSVYGPASPDPDAPTGRGLLDPPVPYTGPLYSDTRLVPESGWVYWGLNTGGHGLAQIVRVQLGETLAPEIVYEGTLGLGLIAAGPDAFYITQDGATVMRLSHDLSSFDQAWGSAQVDDGQLGGDLVSSKHIYLSGIVGGTYQSFRVPLAGGKPESIPPSLVDAVGYGMALRPGRAQGASGLWTVNFETDTPTDESMGIGGSFPNGPTAADTEAFYFTPQTFDGDMYRLPFDTAQPVLLAQMVPPVELAAAAGGRLYLSRQSADGISGSIDTVDVQTGTQLKSTPVDEIGNEDFFVYGDYLYHSIAGGMLKRTALSKLE